MSNDAIPEPNGTESAYKLDRMGEYYAGQADLLNQMRIDGWMVDDFTTGKWVITLPKEWVQTVLNKPHLANLRDVADIAERTPQPQPSTAEGKCTGCNGHGKTWRDEHDYLMGVARNYTCIVCKGTGTAALSSAKGSKPAKTADANLGSKDIEEQIADILAETNREFDRTQRYPLDKATQAITKLITEARISEVEAVMVYSKVLPGVFVRPDDREKFREFSRASVLIAEYASERLKELRSEVENG